MRLHVLEASAFGPFPGTVRVDFDELSEAGLFLLTGPTGSGKTSVLDAVCFGLYGDVPGDRSGARQLRSDHAATGAVPRVRLDCTISGRRFRLVRSPAWQRPKKRGTGTTTEQARVALSEFRAGSWESLSTRMDEVGQLISELLGMTLTQFTQVALLPQGDFQAFLRAGADSRQKLLERLFRTARFREAEGWLAERRRVLARSSQQHEQEVADLLARVAEVTESQLPTEWADTGLAAAAEKDEILAWFQTRNGDCRTDATERAQQHVHATAAAAEAAAGLQSARELAAQQQRHAVAAREATELTSSEPEQAELRAALQAARRATPVLALLTAEDSARSLAEEAAATAATARATACTQLSLLPLAMPDGETLEDHRLQASRFAARVRAALPRRTEREELQRRQERDHAQLSLIDKQVRELTDRGGQMPALLAEARAHHEQVTEASALLPGLSEATIAAAAQRDAGRRAASLEKEHSAATAERLTAVEQVHRRTETWLSVREERLSGMAAEIATQLAVGAECPVCGSHEHPSLARPSPGSADADAERAARRRVDDAEVLRESAVDRERGLGQALAVARAAAGAGSVDELSTAWATARACERAAADLAATVTSSQATVERLEAEARTHQDTLTERRGRIEALTDALGERAEQLATIDRELDDVRAGAEDDLPVLLTRAEAAADACVRAINAESNRDHRRRTQADAEERARAAAHAAGFQDTIAARAAALPEHQQDELSGALRAHDDRVAAVTSVLRDPVLLAAVDAPAPDLAARISADRQAAATLTTAAHANQTATRRRDRAAELSLRLQQRLDRWAPVRRDHTLVGELAAFAEGKSADNRLQMRLSAYVLAFRLGQVVDAANERLSRMSDERYLLQHTSARSAGDRRGGLGLLVRDAWSGTSRDPATLSGGETFIVSLALALGLADVVAHESGGAQLDTLFVDEGFGSLDPETLEDVMETLDTLRSGGRVVGVVSHVSEMRDRIGAKVVLHKSPAGSTLSQVPA